MSCSQHTEDDGSLVAALLREVAALLAAFVERGEEGLIDLRSLPLSDGDRALLEQSLGRGEVAAQISVAGDSEVWETAYAGVWWVRHAGRGNGTTTDQISVSALPEILRTHPADAQAALARMQADLFGEHGTSKGDQA